ncbi:MAG: aminotransferase class v, cysteine desulfurase [Deltaproteobacteria bacterium CSP1-8]|nr:MAG: aminotransferase class v, cysteine desulfurase [Deltaproteobacteria bacterium CSP1-8]
MPLAHIFFDHISTTPLDPRVLEAMMPYLTEWYGNPSSHIHDQGQRAVQAVDAARAEVARFVNANPQEIVFTSGSTEANNLAIKGAAAACAKKGKHLVVSEVEHFSVLNALPPLRNRGYEVTTLSADSDGKVDPDDVRRAIRPDTVLVSVMHANAEIGTIEPIGEIGRITREREVLFHTDATASAGHIPLDVREAGADLVTLSAHNFYGPKGTGALVVREGVRLDSQIDGGFQEMGFRAGTENVPGIAGMGKAAAIASSEMGEWASHLRRLEKRLRDGIASSVTHLHFTGHPTDRLPGHVSFWVEYAEGESLLLFLSVHGVMAASGSACSSNLKGRDEEDLVASHVLRAIGVPSDICTGSITFSMGKGNTEQEVDHVLSVLPGIVRRLWEMSPTYLDYQKKILQGG